MRENVPRTPWRGFSWVFVGLLVSLGLGVLRCEPLTAALDELLASRKSAMRLIAVGSGHLPGQTRRINPRRRRYYDNVASRNPRRRAGIFQTHSYILISSWSNELRLRTERRLSTQKEPPQYAKHDRHQLYLPVWKRKKKSNCFFSEPGSVGAHSPKIQARLGKRRKKKWIYKP